MNVTAKSLPRNNEHRFYIAAVIAAFATVFAGFARTYFLRGVFGLPTLPWLLHLHGALMTSWFVLFLMQTSLIAAHRVDLHKRLGIFGAVLAVLVVVVNSTTLLRASARNFSSRGPDALMILHDFATLAVFALLVGAAISLRRRSEIHKRLMLLATLSILGPGINRIPLGFIKQGGIPVTLLLLDLCIVVAVAVDTFRHRRLHPAFAWGTLLIVGSSWLAYFGEQMHTWMRFAARLVT